MSFLGEQSGFKAGRPGGTKRYGEKTIPARLRRPDVVQCVIADVGPPPPTVWLATTVATSTVRTAVMSQKRESKRLKRR